MRLDRRALAAVVAVLLLVALIASFAGGGSCETETQPSSGETEGTVLGSPASSAPTDTTSPTGAVTAVGVPESAVAATLLQVVDGDTIRVRMSDGNEEKVRYIGIDAPEIAHEDSAGEYLGDEATDHNAELLASGPLYLQTDVDERDDFGRLLAYVWAGQVFVNERMVADGFARAHNYPPNTARQETLWTAHDAAREAGVGIWGSEGD